MREYELYLVMDAAADEETINVVIERVTQLILTGDGQTPGQVIKVEPRGKRRLTYPVKRKVESQDLLITFQTAPQAITEIERVLKLAEPVLRHLVVRTDEK